MKALVQKEIRLLAPAYVLALLLAFVPVWLLSKSNNPEEAFVPFFWFGAMMLALSAFGREFGLGTFPLILAQPVERHRIWQTKIAVLAGGMASAFVVWVLTCAVCIPVMPLAHDDMWRAEFWRMLAGGALGVIVTFAGGLWTTLLLRQAAAAFWVTILVPGAIGLAIGALGGSDALVVAALLIYSILAFFVARRLFFGFQEAGWTGGVVSFPGWRKEAAALQPALRAHRPLAALFWKELQLQQVSLVGMGLLFLAHLAVVAVRKYGQESLGPTLRSGLEVFGGLWLLVPFLVGSSSVAEERKLGAAPNQLCLPVSSRLQYLLKLVFVLVLGGVLSGLLLWIAESIGTAVDAKANIEAFTRPFDGGTLVLSTLLCLGLSLICFYASTLARSIVHALAAAAATAAGVLMAWQLASAIAFGYSPILGAYPWRGSLVFYIALPVLVAAFFTLAYRNFRRGPEDWRLWRHNLLSLAGTLLLIATLTTAGYHRAWELVTPLEPRHGPPTLLEPAAARPSGAPSLARDGSSLSPNRPLQLCSYGGSALAAVLPDGRLWVDRIGYEPGRPILAFGEQTGFLVGGKWGSVSGSQIEPGSNWLAVAANFRQTVATRADGTLWVSEKPRRDDAYAGPVQSKRLNWEEAAPLVRFGQETNWQSVVQYTYESLAVILQKRDGTLWFWSSDHPLPKNSKWLGLRSFEPRRLGAKSDWARVVSLSFECVYAWENDGQSWVLHRPERKTQAGQVITQPGQVIIGDDVVIERSANLDSFKWQSLAPCWPWHAAVREDGTLWAWTNVPPTVSQNGQSYLAQPPVQIGNERDWRSVGGGYGGLAALKADGSLWLWRWPLNYELQREFDLATTAPVRLGTHNDWLGVANALGGTVSLAADGSLWYWWTGGYSDNSDQPMLAPSRRPSKIESILDGKEPGH